MKPGAHWARCPQLSWSILRAIRAVAKADEPGDFLSGKQHTALGLPISGRPNFTKYEDNISIDIPMNPFGTEFWTIPRKGSFFQKTHFFWLIVGNESCNKTALNRCTRTEMRWCRKLTSLDSPVLRDILRPISFSRLLAIEFRTPRVSTAIGSKS